MKALEVKGYYRDDLPNKAPFQPWGSYFALTTTFSKVMVPYPLHI